MRIGIAGTRGIPAHYGGFETFAEALAAGLCARGHEIIVYGRRGMTGSGPLPAGVRSVLGPALKTKHLETVSHTAWSLRRACKDALDALLVCNMANAPLLPLAGKLPTALLVDGFEAERAKWGRAGRAWLKVAEQAARRLPSCVVADAKVIEDYWVARSRVPVYRIAYGVDLSPEPGREALDKLGLESDGYFLYVSRLEPENNAHRVIAAYTRTQSRKPLVIVGDAPYADAYKQNLHALADARVRFVGGIYGRDYRQLQANCFAYIQATEVGGTHPALLEGLAWAPLALVHDTPENREVAGDAGRYFAYRDEWGLAALFAAVEAEPDMRKGFAERARARLAERYRWEAVCDSYEALLKDIN